MNKLPNRSESNRIPTNEEEAMQWLLTLVSASDRGVLHEIPLAEFKRGWFSIMFLYAGLNPDEAADHGTELSDECEDLPQIRAVEPRLLAPYYVQSGWPLVLAPVADEAWRRFEAGELNDEEFYCSAAQIAGMRYRSNSSVKLKS